MSGPAWRDYGQVHLVGDLAAAYRLSTPRPPVSGVYEPKQTSPSMATAPVAQ